MIFKIGDRVKIVESDSLFPTHAYDGNVGKILNIHEMRKTADIAIVEIENSGRAFKIPVTDLVKIEEPETDKVDPVSVFKAFEHLTAERFDELIEAMIVVRVALFGEPEGDD